MFTVLGIIVGAILIAQLLKELTINRACVRYVSSVTPGDSQVTLNAPAPVAEESPVTLRSPYVSRDKEGITKVIHHMADHDADSFITLWNIYCTLTNCREYEIHDNSEDVFNDVFEGSSAYDIAHEVALGNYKVDDLYFCVVPKSGVISFNSVHDGLPFVTPASLIGWLTYGYVDGEDLMELTGWGSEHELIKLWQV